MTIAQDAVAVRTVLLLLGGALSAADILPTIGLIVIAIGATQTTTGGIGGAVLIIAPVHERLWIEVLITRVVGKDRNAAPVVKPSVVGDHITGGVSQLDLPWSDRHGQGRAMAHELGALIGIGWVSRIAQGQFQTEFPVAIRGFEGHIAKDELFLGGVLRIDMGADFGLEVRGHLGTAPQQLALGTSAHVTPGEVHGWHLVIRQPQQLGHLLAIRARSRGVGDLLDLEERHLGVFGMAMLGRGLAHLGDDVRKGTEELEPLGPAVQLVTHRLPSGLVDAEGVAALTGVRAAFIARVGGLELAIGGHQLAFDQAKASEELHHDGESLVDHAVPDTGAEVTQVIFPGEGVVQTSEFLVATALVAWLQVAAEVSIIDVSIHVGDHL
jgi:hypothetical protein